MKKTTTTRIAGAGALALWALSSQAAAADAKSSDEGPKYTYIEGDYVYIDVDDFDANGDGGAVEGSFALTEMLHLFAGYVDASVDDHGPSVDLTDYQVGLGLNVPLTPTVDFVGRASWVHAKVEFGPIDNDDDGFQLSAGVRAMITPVFELNGDLSYTDISGDDEKAIEVGAVYNFTPMLAGVVGASIGDNETVYNVGLRSYIPR